MDMDTSKIIDGKETLQAAGKRIFDEIIAVASGKITKAERFRSEGFLHIQNKHEHLIF